MDWKKILLGIGITGGVVGVGYLTYKLYKKYKEEKEFYDAQPTAEELWEEIQAQEVVENHERKVSKDIWDDFVSDHIDEEEEYDDEDWQYHIDTLELDEEVDLEVLRFPVDSEEAFKQYKMMSLSDLSVGGNGELYSVLWDLFDHDYIRNDLATDDINIESNMWARRCKFFGEGTKHTMGNISWAEVIIFFAEKIQFELSEDYIDVLHRLVDNLAMYGYSQDYMAQSVDALNNNEFVNPQTGSFGLFGLSHADANAIGHEFGLGNVFEITLWKQFQKWLALTLGLEGQYDYFARDVTHCDPVDSCCAYDFKKG